MDVFGNVLLGILKFSGVQNIEQLENFCNRYGYAPNVVLSDMIKVYMKAIYEWEKQKGEEVAFGTFKAGVFSEPKYSYGVHV